MIKKSTSELIRIFEFAQMETDVNKSDTYHYVKHRFREEMIVPIAAISNNIDFLIYDATKHVKTSDDVNCVVVEWSEKHICDIENLVLEKYERNAWDFIKTWHKHEPCMSSMNFIVMKVKKCE